MKNLIIITVSFLTIAAASSCKKDTTAQFNNLVASWVKSPVSPGGNTYLKVTDNSNFQVGYALGPNYSETVHGTYTYNSTQVVFTYTGGPGAYCLNVQGTYQYSISNNQLSLSPVSDQCADSTGTPRSNILGGTWTQ